MSAGYTAGVVTVMISWIRVPLATILFIGSAALLISPQSPLLGLGGYLGTVGALGCIVCLVYSFTLYSNLDVMKR